MLEWLASAGIRTWQLLPLNALGPGHSPYASPSAFAAETAFLSLEHLVQDGLLDPVIAPPATHRVDWEAVAQWKRPLLERAARALWAKDPIGTERWVREQHWVHDWALFRALHGEQGPLIEWPAKLRQRDPQALAQATEHHAEALRCEMALQRLFDHQWRKLRQAATRRGIDLLGDMPLFVSDGGADTWTRPELFCVDEHGRTTCRAGVPPDYFSPQGQLWGNPHYAWPAHRAEGFAWWKARMARCLEHVDRVRLDHFRGLVAAWAVEPGAETAIHGEWLPGPGAALLEALGNVPLIAEDLGTIDQPVRDLRDQFALPGMKILQFAFGDGPDHDFLPHNYAHDRWVVYTGTHDNDTVHGWYASADPKTAHNYRVYCGRDGSDVAWDLIRLAWSSTAKDAIAPLQDIMDLGADSRMNTPGTVGGNWSWRAQEMPGSHVAIRLRTLTEAYGRLGPTG
jgi:4-alpha-glucanotransferase